MKTKCIIVLIAGLLITQNLFANSPITSVTISEAYKNSKIIQVASKAKGKLTDELMDYLIDKRNPIELKMALINELGWEFKGKNNSEVFAEYLEKNKVKNINKASADILICFAYLKALDDCSNVEEAITYAQKAKAKNKKSYTIHIICAIIEAQKAVDDNWCEVYTLTNNVRTNKKLIKDMREEAVAIIFEYMDSYKNYCE